MYSNCPIPWHWKFLSLQKTSLRKRKSGLYHIIMRRTAYSIPINLMEGAYRLSSKEYRQFVGIAKGSAGEIKYQLLLAKDLRYIFEDEYSILLPRYERVSQMLTKLAKSLERS
jgi:four helix bundle protein